MRSLEENRSFRNGRGNTTKELTQIATKALVDIELESINLFKLMRAFERVLLRLEEGQKKFPKDAQIIATMVDHYFRNNEYNKAIEKLEELVIADPSNGRAHPSQRVRSSASLVTISFG